MKNEYSQRSRNTWFFFCVLWWFFDLGKFFVSIGKNQIFFLALFFSLFRCCFFGHLLQDIFFCEKKSKVPTTMSHSLIFDFSFLFLDWIWGTAQLLISYRFFLRYFFFPWEQRKFCCDLSLFGLFQFECKHILSME
mgnify:CR=1 FL=1